MNKKLLFILVLFLAILSGSYTGLYAQSTGNEEISFRRFSPQNEILQSTVNCVYQDHKGFMWFGTWAGLYRYDGLHTRAFKPQKNNPHSLKGRKIRTIYEDRSRRLWIGSMDEGLHLFDRKLEQFVQYKHIPDNPSSISSNDISAICEDQEGNIWVGTSEGINQVVFPATSAMKAGTKTSAPKIRRYTINEGKVKRITAIYQDGVGRIWVGTEEGLYYFRPKNQSGKPIFTRINIKPGTSDYYPRNYISSITSDSDSLTGKTIIWLGTRGGLTKMILPPDWREDAAVTTMKHYQQQDTPFALSNNQVRAVFQIPGEEGQLWIGTEDGLNLFDVKNEKFYTYLTDNSDPHSLSNNSITALIKDRSGVLWIATESGLNTFDPYQKKFGLYQASAGNTKGLTTNNISALSAGKAGEIWVGTYGGGLHKITPDSLNGRLGRIQPYPFTGTHSNSAANHIYTICTDHTGAVWVGTNGEGIYRFKPEEINAGDKNIQRYVHYKQNYANTHGLTDNYVLTLYEDRRGTLWAGTWNGDLHRFDPVQNRFISLSNQPGIPKDMSQFPITTLLEDHLGVIWVGTRGGGVFGLTASLGNRYNVKHYLTNGQSNSLSNNFINCLFEDKGKNLWIGTEDGLNRLNPKTGKFSVMNESNGLPDNVIQGILQDSQGLIWLSTTRGITQFSPGKKSSQQGAPSQFFRNFGKEDGLQGNFFNSNACICNPEGMLFFGGINGLNACNPAQVGRNPHPPQVAITGFLIFNQLVPVGKSKEGREILRQSISETKEIKLAYDENSVSFEFAALHFASPSQNRYAYKLEGFDKEWTFMPAPQNVAHYTNLDPGNYTFRLRASNNDEVWNNQGATLSLIITPPFWKTGWAYLVYALLSIALLYLLRKWILMRAEFRHSLALERVKRENAEALHQLKLRFFTNISHEIRTPLTLITGILDKVLHSQEYPPRLQNQLWVMHKNGQQLLRLIHQLLDFRKHESGYLSLKAAEGNLIPFLEGVCQSFRELALERNITYHFKTENECIWMWYDRDKLQKIVTNLLSNAFKFTPVDGQILVEVHKVPGDQPVDFLPKNLTSIREGWVKITVQDNGPGIGAEQLNRIFDMYFQAEQSPVQSNIGTGIGLALSKSLAELHYGSLTVTSKEGEGASFFLYLPLGKAHLQASEIRQEFLPAEPPNSGMSLTPVTGSPIKLQEQNREVPLDAPLLLVVEDQTDLRLFIAQLFEEKYRVIMAANGVEGLAMATEHVPDLIISDVLMPQMSGIELCHRIKTDERTSHIPFILLTARTDLSHQTEGLETGADDYISKPFGVQALELKVRNLLTLRENIRKRSGQKKFLSTKEVATNSLDEAFLEKIILIVGQHLSDQDFKVEDFTKVIGMSRIQLYRKLKALTGLTVNEFVRNQRLQRAAQLLEKKGLTVAEVTYQVGFGDLKYFRNCFKEYFGVNPSDYVNHKPVYTKKKSI